MRQSSLRGLINPELKINFIKDLHYHCAKYRTTIDREMSEKTTVCTRINHYRAFKRMAQSMLILLIKIINLEPIMHTEVRNL